METIERAKLAGSEKQINWASEIREKLQNNLDELEGRSYRGNDLFEMAVFLLENMQDAGDWISMGKNWEPYKNALGEPMEDSNPLDRLDGQNLYRMFYRRTH